MKPKLYLLRFVVVQQIESCCKLYSKCTLEIEGLQQIRNILTCQDVVRLVRVVQQIDVVEFGPQLTELVRLA